MPEFGKTAAGLRRHLYSIIFESDTAVGRRFDLALIAVILISIAVVVLDSVQSISTRRARLMDALEWCFTLLFALEYLARLYCVEQRWR